MHSPSFVERLKDLTKILKLKPISVSVVDPDEAMEANKSEPVLVVEHQVHWKCELDSGLN
jgi:hypothetical protein